MLKEPLPHIACLVLPQCFREDLKALKDLKVLLDGDFVERDVRVVALKDIREAFQCVLLHIEPGLIRGVAPVHDACATPLHDTAAQL